MYTPVCISAGAQTFLCTNRCSTEYLFRETDETSTQYVSHPELQQQENQMIIIRQYCLFTRHTDHVKRSKLNEIHIITVLILNKVNINKSSINGIVLYLYT